MIGTIITAALTAASLTLGAAANWTTIITTAENASGSASSSIHTDAPKKRTTTDTASSAPCAAILDTVRRGLPRDLGSSWAFADLPDGIAGLYYPGQNRIEIADDLACKWIPYAATHEWMHQLQDRSGLMDHTEVYGYQRAEFVAECAARIIERQNGWLTGRSYPELAGVPCSTFSTDVQTLLDRI